MDVNTLRAAWMAARMNPDLNRRRGLTVALSLAALPSLAGLLWLGWHWGRALPGADPAVAGVALAAVLGGLATLSGTWDGSCAMAFGPFQPFGAQPGALFLAELAVGLWTPLKRFFWAAGLAFCAGAGWARPCLLPWLLPALPAALLTLLALERLVGVLTRLFGQTARNMLLLGALFLGMRRLLGLLLAGGNLRGVVSGSHLTVIALDPHRLARLLPSTWLLGALGAAARRGWPTVGYLGFLGASAALLALTFWALRPDLLGQRPALATRGRGREPWAFRSPWVGVAQLHWQRVVSSKMGRLLLFLPILALVGMVDPLAFGFRLGPSWIIGCSGFMLLPLGRKLACNLFGLDRAAVRSYWSLPLEDRDLLLGKLAGTALFQALIVGLLLFGLAFATPLRPLELLVCGGFCLALCLTQLWVGVLRSVEEPAPLDPEAINPAELDDPTLATLGRLLLPWLLLVALLTWCNRYGALPALGAMLAAAALAGLALRRRFPQALRLLALRREALTQTLAEGARSSS